MHAIHYRLNDLLSVHPRQSESIHYFPLLIVTRAAETCNTVGKPPLSLSAIGKRSFWFVAEWKWFVSIPPRPFGHVQTECDCCDASTCCITTKIQHKKNERRDLRIQQNL